MTTPRRIQLRRVKGWRKPPEAVVVSRPTRWGNPFTVANAIEVGYCSTEERGRALVVEAFRDWLNLGAWQHVDGKPKRDWILEHLPELRGRDLACWCPLDKPCHADVLLALANAPATAP